MAKHSSKEEEYKDTISDVYDLVTESGTTRADMQAALDAIAELCTEAVPELDQSSNDDDDDD